MNTQAQQAVSHQAPLTRRQIAARKHAAAQKAINQAAKGVVSGPSRQHNPGSGSLDCRHMRKCGTDVVYATTLLQNSVIRGSGAKRGYAQGDYVAGELRGLFFSPAGTCLADAVALMREAGISVKYWGKAAMERAAQKKAKARRTTPLPGSHNNTAPPLAA